MSGDDLGPMHAHTGFKLHLRDAAVAGTRTGSKRWSPPKVVFLSSSQLVPPVRSEWVGTGLLKRGHAIGPSLSEVQFEANGLAPAS